MNIFIIFRCLNKNINFIVILQVFNINILLVSLVILIIELIYGGWVFPGQQNNCSYLLCSVNLKYESKVTGETSYIKDKFGLRNRNKLKSDIDLLVIGGSTSDQRYVDNNETWDYLLQEMFKRDGTNIDIGGGMRQISLGVVFLVAQKSKC